MDAPGMEALAPVLTDGMQTLIDVLPDDALVLVCEPERDSGEGPGISSRPAASSWPQDGNNAAAGNTCPSTGGASYRELPELAGIAASRGCRLVVGGSFRVRASLDAIPAPAYRGDWGRDPGRPARTFR